MSNLVWHAGPLWHERLSETTSIYTETGDRLRRCHRKSRNGCVECRKRRVKCSEDRPICRNCRRLQFECKYSRQARARCDESGINATEVQHARMASISTRIPATVKIPAWPLAGTLKLDADLASFRPLVLSYVSEGLNHFVQCDRLWLKNPNIQDVMQSKAVSQVTNHLYLSHAVLAVSAAHLAAICPDGQLYKTVSLVHWQMFLRAYRCCLESDISSQDVDAMFFASHLHSMLVSVHDQQQDREGKWVISAWIQSMQGVKALWDVPHVIVQLRNGVWGDWTRSCEGAYQRTIGDSSTASKTTSMALAALRDYCRLLPDEEYRACEERINVLAVVEQNLLLPQGLNCLSWYIARAPADYLARLQRGEEMPLLLLLYWCQLASRAGQWWLAQAACYESHKIHTYLSRPQSSKELSTLLNLILEMG